MSGSDPRMLVIARMLSGIPSELADKLTPTASNEDLAASILTALDEHDQAQNTGQAGQLLTGRELYERWCNAPGSDREQYWFSMNPAGKRAWERLAGEVSPHPPSQPQTRRYDDKGRPLCFECGLPQPRHPGGRECQRGSTTPPAHGAKDGR